MNKYIEREVFSRCDETCPAVDEAIDNMLSDIGSYVADANKDEVSRLVEIMRRAVKDDGTERLRDALRECVSERLDLESEVAALTAEVASLNDRIAELDMA